MTYINPTGFIDNYFKDRQEMCHLKAIIEILHKDIYIIWFIAIQIYAHFCRTKSFR